MIQHLDIGEPEQDTFWIEEHRPYTRSECIDGPRPCPWVSCRHHLYLVDDNRGGVGNVRTCIPSGDLFDMKETCVLDVADELQRTEETMTLEAVGPLLGGITRERVRQIERTAKRALLRAIHRLHPDTVEADWWVHHKDEKET